MNYFLINWLPITG